MKQQFLITYLPVARQDLVDIFDYLACQNLEAARILLQTVDQTVRHLADLPLSGAIPKDRRLKLLGYRMVIIGNYLVFYVVSDTVVEIRRVLHGSHNYSFLL